MEAYLLVSVYQLANIFFPAWFSEFGKSEVHSVEDIIKYNEAHADICLPPSWSPFTIYTTKA